MLNGASLFPLLKGGNQIIFKALLYDINEAIEAKDLKELPLEEVIPKQYHEFLQLFNHVLADWSPSHRPNIDHEVLLKEGKTPSCGSLSKMSREVQVVIKEWLEDNVIQGFIRQSLSRYPAP
jgi:hypothetical protein